MIKAATRRIVASRFFARKARYEADAIKKASSEYIVDCNGIIYGEEPDEEATFETGKSAIDYLENYDLNDAIEEYGIAVGEEGTFWECSWDGNTITCKRL
jgi:hypothetical protein